MENMVVIGILIINQRPADWNKFRIQVGYTFYNIRKFKII